MFRRRHFARHNFSIIAIRLIFVAIFIILVGRLFDLQIRQHDDFIKEAEAIHETTAIVKSERGKIYFQDKNGNEYPLAINKKYYTVYVVPKEIEEPEVVINKLSQLLSLTVDEVASHVNKPNDPYEEIKKRIDDENIINQIQELKLKGVYLKSENYRFYPFNSLASQTIGFVAEADDGQIKGRYGLELYYDDILSGRSGVFTGVRDAFGRLVRSVFSHEESAKEGADLITTLDKNIQFSAEEILKELIEKRDATKGSLIVMEAKTGKILALANYPTFNLNEFNKVTNYSVFRNYAAEDRYEPGSIVKSLTMAAALDLGLVTPDTTYDDKGYYLLPDGRKLINYNNEVYGKNITMTRVLERSINTGAIFVGQKLGAERLRQYFKKFGLDKVTGIDLPNEIAGDLSNLEYPKVNLAYLSTASYGLGIAITPLELLKAYSAISNKGLMVTPYLVAAIRDSNNVITPVTVPEPERVLSEKTAETLSNMLVSVVLNGFGINTKIKGYSTGGKTGTAFIPKGKGYSEDMIHTYIGYFPASDPQYLILVKMDRPLATSDSASHTVTIAFKQMEQFLINYFNIPPDEK
ncbi:MAG: penicillin-binding protein 2 [Parcubacteria group bacterium]|nr:penicillin-binding protein 2 [Parcubacteria group bacterium]